MKDFDVVTETQINAYIDNELDDSERARIIHAINNDRTLANNINEIRQNMDLLSLAYNKPPLVKDRKHLQHADKKKIPNSLAAGLLLVIGATIGLMVSPANQPLKSSSFTAINEYSPVSTNNKKVLIHISSMDSKRIEGALDKAEETLLHSKNAHKKLDLILVANADGLGLLREGSPYAGRISTISEKYSNIKFLACGIAIETAHLKEGRKISLLPEAHRIPAALNEILNRLREGWLYVKS